MHVPFILKDNFKTIQVMLTKVMWIILDFFVNKNTGRKNYLKFLFYFWTLSNTCTDTLTHAFRN